MSLYRTLALLLLCLWGCHGASAPDSAYESPSPGGSSADIEPHGLPTEVDLPSWIQGADDFVEGTVVDVRAAWSPLIRYGSDPTPVPVEDCARGSAALDLVLSDIRSLRSAWPLDTLVVRLVVGTHSLEALNAPRAELGSPEITEWSLRHDLEGTPSFTVGMRVGGPIYHNPGHATPVFPTGVGYPIYRVQDGQAQFMLRDEFYGTPYERVPLEPWQGLSLDPLWAEVTAAATYPIAPLASRYRDYKGMDDPERYWLFGARCSLTHEEANTPLPCDDTGDACR